MATLASEFHHVMDCCGVVRVAAVLRALLDCQYRRVAFGNVAT
jgi:hypothetical protein